MQDKNHAKQYLTWVSEKIKGFESAYNLKTHLIVVLTAIACSAGVYAVVYTMSYTAVLEDIKDRSGIVNEYALSVIAPSSFININSMNDETMQTYLDTQNELDHIRRIANVQYLYTAKENEHSELIYVIDGLPSDDPDFRHAGAPIEEELWEDLWLCLQGEIVNGKDIYHTEWGNVYVTYWPVRDNDGTVMGALGMEFNVDSIYHSYRSVRLYSLILSAALILVFSSIARITLKKVSDPFYKKLAYTDILTELPNRMAFEERIKECKKYLSDGIPVTMIVFDLNDLKVVNDLQGHTQGDIYIKKSSRLIDRSLNALGTTYRIGGDELAAIVIGHPDEKIQDALSKLYRGGQFVLKTQPFSCAYGMATFDPANDKSIHDVFNRADERMYTEKKRQKSYGKTTIPMAE